MPGVWKRWDGDEWEPQDGNGLGGGGEGPFQSAFDFFVEPRTSEALDWTSSGGSYIWAFNALTASTHNFRFDLGLRDILSAKWRVAWAPKDAANGIRLTHADPGPLNLTQIAELTGYSDTDPIHSVVDVTTEIQALIDGGVEKYIGNQYKIGSTSQQVYLSRLEIVWA